MPYDNTADQCLLTLRGAGTILDAVRALVIDDDASMRRLLARCLGAWGWETAECASASEALAAFSKGRFKLVVCDVDLPDGDGIALTQALRRSEPSLQIVVASGDPENLERARRAGLTACLQKPFELDALRAMI